MLDLFCNTCEVFVCQYCTTTDQSGRVQSPLKSVADNFKKELAKTIEPINEMAANAFKLCFKVSNAGKDV